MASDSRSPETILAARPISQLEPGWAPLVRRARSARRKAYAPYSKFLVGCALEGEVGAMHSGCNVENASYSAAICAERTAIVKMVSKGSQKIRRIVIVTSSDDPIFPCGVCLQVIHEFGPTAQVLAIDRGAQRFRKA